MEPIQIFQVLRITNLKPVKGNNFDPKSFFYQQTFGNYSKDYQNTTGVAAEETSVQQAIKLEVNDAIDEKQERAVVAECKPEVEVVEVKVKEIHEFFREKLRNCMSQDVFNVKRSQPYILKEILNSSNDLEDSLIYSNSNLHPLSFSLGQYKFCFKSRNEVKYPTPKLLCYEDFEQCPKQLIYPNVVEGNKLDDHKGIIATDPYLLKRFSGIVKDMIGQILRRLVGGPPVSLSVRIFEPKSTLHRNIEAWSYAPIYLNKASQSNISPIERVKLVTTFVVSGLVLTCKQLKPFNPLIGETFEGEFYDGTKVYGEHIGHYPTLSRYLIIGKNNDFKLHCCFDLDAITSSFGGEITIVQKGNITIEFPKINEKIVYRMPLMKLENCRSEEERNCYVYDFLELYDIKNEIKSMISFAHNSKKKLNFIGAIVSHKVDVKLVGSEKEKKVTSKYLENFNKYIDSEDKAKYLTKNKLSAPISVITGDFTEFIKFDSDKYWDLKADEGHYAYPCRNVLPSDTRYREDLIWLYYALHYSRNKAEYDLFMKYSQGWKSETEYIQRKEREIRAEFRKKLNKK